MHLKKRKRIQKLFIDEEINTNDYKDLIQDIQTQKAFITNSINSLNEDQKSVVDYKTIKHLLCDIKLNWEHLDTSQRNAFIHQFIDSIVLDVNNGNPIIKELNFC